MPASSSLRRLSLFSMQSSGLANTTGVDSEPDFIGYSQRLPG
jgi:hypothetical protein